MLNPTDDSSTAIPEKKETPELAQATPSSVEAKSLVELDRLFDIWAKAWAEKHKAKVKQMAYQKEDVRALLKDSQLNAHVEFLSAKILSEREIEETNTVSLSTPKIVNDQAGWELIVDNNTNAVNPSKAILKRTLTNQSQSSWTASVKVNLALEFGGGIPAAMMTKITTGLELAYSTTRQKTDTKSKEETFEQNVNCQPWHKTFAAILTEEEESRVQTKVKVNLTGGVVIRCSKSIAHAGTSYRNDQEKHEKWYITIQAIFNDLTTFINTPLVNAADQVFIQESLPSFEQTEKGVSFVLAGETQERRMIRPRVEIRHEIIPGHDKALAHDKTPVEEDWAIAATSSAIAAVADSEAEITNKGVTPEGMVTEMKGSAEAAKNAGLFAASKKKILASGSAISLEAGSKAKATNQYNLLNSSHTHLNEEEDTSARESIVKKP